MHKYANLQNICKIYAIICINPTSMDLKRKYAKKYAKNMQLYAKYVVMKYICKICRNLHSPLCWCYPAGNNGMVIMGNNDVITKVIIGNNHDRGKNK